MQVKQLFRRGDVQDGKENTGRVQVVDRALVSDQPREETASSVASQEKDSIRYSE